MCAGARGTRYGKRRHDHNFVEGSGIEGGWLCPTNISCRDEPTGEHYCGMCACQDWLSTIGALPDQANDRTVPLADVGNATTSPLSPAEAADDGDAPDALEMRTAQVSFHSDWILHGPEPAAVSRRV